MGVIGEADSSSSSTSQSKNRTNAWYRARMVVGAQAALMQRHDEGLELKRLQIGHLGRQAVLDENISSWAMAVA